MGHSTSKTIPATENVQQREISFGRAKTMLDISQANLDVASGDFPPGLQRSSSDTTLNTSMSASQGSNQKSYQRALEWGRNEHFFKLANTFHTNNY